MPIFVPSTFGCGVVGRSYQHVRIANKKPLHEGIRHVGYSLFSFSFLFVSGQQPIVFIYSDASFLILNDIDSICLTFLTWTIVIVVICNGVITTAWGRIVSHLHIARVKWYFWNHYLFSSYFTGQCFKLFICHCLNVSVSLFLHYLNTICFLNQPSQLAFLLESHSSLSTLDLSRYRPSKTLVQPDDIVC